MAVIGAVKGGLTAVAGCHGCYTLRPPFDPATAFLGPSDKPEDSRKGHSPGNDPDEGNACQEEAGRLDFGAGLAVVGDDGKVIDDQGEETGREKKTKGEKSPQAKTV